MELTNKGLLSRLYNDLSKLNNKKTNRVVFKWEKDLNRTSPNRIYRWGKVYEKMFTGVTQIKIKMPFNKTCMSVNL